MPHSVSLSKRADASTVYTLNCLPYGLKIYIYIKYISVNLWRDADDDDDDGHQLSAVLSQTVRLGKYLPAEQLQQDEMNRGKKQKIKIK